MMIRIDYSDIPDGYCVIAVKNNYLYLHFEDGNYCLINRMYGCLVMSRDLAETLIEDIEITTDIDNLVIKEFGAAYKQHGLMEKQIAYN